MILMLGFLLPQPAVAGPQETIIDELREEAEKAVDDAEAAAQEIREDLDDFIVGISTCSTDGGTGDGFWVYHTTPLGRDPAFGSYSASWSYTRFYNLNGNRCELVRYECTIVVGNDVWAFGHNGDPQQIAGQGTWKEIPYTVDTGSCDGGQANIQSSILGTSALPVDGGSI